MSALRGDTLYFERVTVLRQPVGATPCAHSGPGYVVVAEHPDLRAERMAFNGVLTFASVVAIPVGFAVLVNLLWSGT